MGAVREAPNVLLLCPKFGGDGVAHINTYPKLKQDEEKKYQFYEWSKGREKSVSNGFSLLEIVISFRIYIDIFIFGAVYICTM